MKRIVPSVLVAACLLLPASSAYAATGTGVPPPPPPPGCKPCGVPPSPPTPVPTLAPTVVPTEAVVDVHLASTKVSRGHEEKVNVAASTDDQVAIEVRYRTGKPKLYRATVGSTGTAVTTWKIPRTAPVGKGSIKISVSGAEMYSKILFFLVTK